MAPDALKASFLRAAAIRYLWSFIGTPYRWGGDDPMQGFDCSGLVVEVLKGVGLLRANEDLTANGLYVRYGNHEVVKPYAGCLILWLNVSGFATHVEFMADDFHTIGASGGGSSTTSSQAAVDQNAFVKMRPVGYRGTNYKAVDPFLGAV